VPYFVYCMASSRNGTLYLGVTSDLVRRVYQHKSKTVRGFTSQYCVTQLVWYECYDDAINAIAREKELKKWRRAWKLELIEKMNPEWIDLYDGICR
jgi:putative endonuclease